MKQKLPVWWPLLPLGLLSILSLGLLVACGGFWQHTPLLAGVCAILMGLSMLGAVWIVRHRSLGRWGEPWIVLVGIVLVLLSLGITVSDDINRYVLEGQQILHGQNPYAIAPNDAKTQGLVEEHIAKAINHPEKSTIYPPMALYLEGLGQVLWRGIWGWRLLCVLACCSLIFVARAWLRASGGSPGMLVALAWNPVLVLFGSGEAHNDCFMALALTASLWALALNRWSWASVALAAAVLIKPFALIVCPLFFRRLGWRGSLLFIFFCVVCYLPLMGAEKNIWTTVKTFGGEMHFHGVIDPWLRWCWPQSQTSLRMVDLCQREYVIRLILFGILGLGLLGLWFFRRRLNLPQRMLGAMALLLICLPTLHPWYLLGLVAMLPVSQAWGLLVWTASAGVYWLHGIVIARTGLFQETSWVVTLAHLPALTLLAWEAFRPPKASS